MNDLEERAQELEPDGELIIRCKFNSKDLINQWSSPVPNDIFKAYNEFLSKGRNAMEAFEVAIFSDSFRVVSAEVKRI